MDPKMMKQLQQMQNKLMKAQADLANETVTGTAGGGVVSVEMNGHHDVVAVTLDPDAVDPEDVELLQDMLVAAFNEALKNAQDMAQDRLGSITGGMNIPGMF